MRLVRPPCITERTDGAYVRHDDHEALMQEKDAEIAALERTVVDQTVVITEFRGTALQAIKLPNISVRITSAEDDEGNGDMEYEVIDATMQQGDQS